MEDFALLLDPPTSRGRAVLDADEVAVEDIGLIRRFLDRTPAWSLLLVGVRSSAPIVRAFRSHPRSEFWAWPIDVDELELLLTPDTEHRAPITSLAEAAHRGVGSTRRPGTAADKTFATIHHASVPNLARAADPQGKRQRGDFDWDLERDHSKLSPEIIEIEAILAKLPDSSIGHHGVGQPDVRGSLALARDSEPVLGSHAHQDPHEVEFDDPDEEELEVTFSPEELSDAETEDDSDDRADEQLAFLEDVESEIDAKLREEEIAAESIAYGGAGVDVIPTPAAPSDGEWARHAPDFYRHQVAELADLAQCIELSHETMQRDPEKIPTELETLGRDVQRLVQFSRTLHHMVSPTPVESRQFELGTLIENLLGELVASETRMPMFLFRNETGLTVLAERAPLIDAFSALLQLICACAEPEDRVRVVTERKPSSGQIQVEFRFPRGPLTDPQLAELAVPYALRRALPELSPNGLAAAVAILRGHGGSLALRPMPGENDKLMMRVTVPESPAATEE
ncbi:MAG: hypothetical protein ACI841_003402 [Planctomycetota bacterium]|jgi:hypothetical protein